MHMHKHISLISTSNIYYVSYAFQCLMRTIHIMGLAVVREQYIADIRLHYIYSCYFCILRIYFAELS